MATNASALSNLSELVFARVRQWLSPGAASDACLRRSVYE
jgi:hypothetical protein